MVPHRIFKDKISLPNTQSGESDPVVSKSKTCASLRWSRSLLGVGNLDYIASRKFRCPLSILIPRRRQVSIYHSSTFTETQFVGTATNTNLMSYLQTPCERRELPRHCISVRAGKRQGPRPLPGFFRQNCIFTSRSLSFLRFAAWL